MSETSALQRELQVFREFFSEQLAQFRADVKEELAQLTQSLSQLAGLQGEIRRTNDAMGRIGREVEDLQKRVRHIEQVMPVTTHQLKSGERWFWFLVSSITTAAGSVLTGVVVFYLTRP